MSKNSKAKRDKKRKKKGLKGRAAREPSIQAPTRKVSDQAAILKDMANAARVLEANGYLKETKKSQWKQKPEADV